MRSEAWVRVFVRALLSGVAALLLACGSEPDVAAPSEPASVEIDPTEIAGLYEVEGTTTVLATGDEREIAGKVILAMEGDRYTSTFSLTTTSSRGTSSRARPRRSS
jgi:hypothetical protein